MNYIYDCEEKLKRGDYVKFATKEREYEKLRFGRVDYESLLTGQYRVVTIANEGFLVSRNKIKKISSRQYWHWFNKES